MFKYLCKKKAQSSLEYAILIIIVLGALLTIQVYIKRGIQGRMRAATDDIGEQYEVGSMNVVKVTKFYSRTNELANIDGSESKLLDAETTNITLNQELLGNIQQSYWGK